MILTSRIPAAKGLSTTIARLCLWNDNQIIVDKNDIQSKIISIHKQRDKYKFFTYILSVIILLLLIFITTQIILSQSSKYYYKIKLENSNTNKTIKQIQRSIHHIEENIKHKIQDKIVHDSE